MILVISVLQILLWYTNKEHNSTCRLRVSKRKQFRLEHLALDLSDERSVELEALDAGVLAVSNADLLTVLQRHDAVGNVERT